MLHCSLVNNRNKILPMFHHRNIDDFQQMGVPHSGTTKLGSVVVQDDLIPRESCSRKSGSPFMTCSVA